MPHAAKLTKPWMEGRSVGNDIGNSDQFRENAQKIRRLVAGVKGDAASAALLLADEYERRAMMLEGVPSVVASMASAERVQKLVAGEQDKVTSLSNEEAELTKRLQVIRNERSILEARIDAILTTAQLIDFAATG